VAAPAPAPRADPNRAFQPPAGWQPPAVASAAPPAEPRATAPAAAASIAPAEPSTAGTMAGTIFYGPNSADLTDIGRSELARVAGEINSRRVRYVDVRAYAGGEDQSDARKVALARALSISSYLIDLKVKAQIRISGWAAPVSGASERVEIWLPE
jgi:outer membrane protein OmpA-like peptidoglycan-associated protein